MEKAILKTLIYADIFEFPLTIFEIHKWLIGKKCNLRQVEKAVKKLNQESRIKNQGEYYFLSGRKSTVSKRIERKKQSKKYLQKAILVASILKIIPWIKLIGISGGLAMENADKKDDIDVFVITEKNRVWISRLIMLCLLTLFNLRRKVSDKKNAVGGKICLNLFLDIDHLEQNKKDLYTAHEVLQMCILWERNGIYSKYLADNEWVFKLLPNWIGNQYRVSGIVYRGNKKKTHYTIYTILYTLMNHIENFAKRFQLMIMKSPKGMERIEEGALYFHPSDIRPKILIELKERFSRLNLSTS